jgi:hypothetical protein
MDESLREEYGESELTPEGIIKNPDLTLNIARRSAGEGGAGDSMGTRRT